MLQARLFGYGDAHRYRLGINHSRLGVNAPKGIAEGASNYGRDGFMRFDENGGRTKNYEPNSFDGPVQTNEELYTGFNLTGASGHHPQVPREVDDFRQAGDLYRLQPAAAQQRLVDNIVGNLGLVSKEEIITRSVGHFRKADETFGGRIAEGIAVLRGKVPAGIAR